MEAQNVFVKTAIIQNRQIQYVEVMVGRMRRIVILKLHNANSAKRSSCLKMYHAVMPCSSIRLILIIL